MTRAIKFLLLAAMLLIVAANAFCDAADVSINTNAKPGVISGVILDSANAQKELTPEEQAARFKTNRDADITSCTKAIELTPNDWRVYARRGHPKLSKGDYEAAIADYTKAIELSTNILAIASGYHVRGNAKWRKHDWDGAITDMTKAVELDPIHYSISDPFLANTYNKRGYVKLSNGDLGGAIADFNKALEISPDVETNPDNESSLSSYNKRGGAKRFKGDLDGAKNDFIDALKLNPGLSEAQMRLDEMNKK